MTNEEIEKIIANNRNWVNEYPYDVDEESKERRLAFLEERKKEIREKLKQDPNYFDSIDLEDLRHGRF